MALLNDAPEIPHDMAHPIGPQCYDLPIMVTPIAESTWSVVHVIERACCASISANRRWNAHDFCLVGRDVRAGQTLTCRAWMCYEQLDSLDQTRELAERLVKQTGGD